MESSSFLELPRKLAVYCQTRDGPADPLLERGMPRKQYKSLTDLHERELAAKQIYASEVCPRNLLTFPQLSVLHPKLLRELGGYTRQLPSSQDCEQVRSIADPLVFFMG